MEQLWLRPRVPETLYCFEMLLCRVLITGSDYRLIQASFPFLLGQIFISSF